MNSIPEGWEVVSSPQQQNKNADEFNPEDWEIVHVPDSESMVKSAFRTALQIPLGAAEGTIGGFGSTVGEALNSLRSGKSALPESLAEEKELELLYPEEFGPGRSPQIQEQPFTEAFNKQKQYYPTVSNAGQIVEEHTGLPLTPRNALQRTLRLASSFGRAKGANTPQRVGAGGAFATGSGVLQGAGIPEPLANIATGAMLFPTQVGRAITPQPQKQIPYIDPNVSSRVQRSLAPQGTQYPSDFEAGSDLQKYLMQYPVENAPGLPNLPEIPTEPSSNLQPPSEPQFRLNVPKPQAQATFQPSGKKLPVTKSPIPSSSYLRPEEGISIKTPEEKMGHVISSSAIDNPVKASSAIRNLVDEISEKDYKKTSKLYDKSEKLNSRVETIHPQLASELQETIRNLSELKNKSTVTNKMIDLSNNLLNAIAAVDAHGNISGYLPFNNQAIINEIREINRLVDFDFAHGSPKNEFKKITASLNRAVERAALNQKNQQALMAFQDAKQSHIDWQNTYTTRLMHPWLDKKDFEPEKMFNSATSLDSYLQMKKILDKSSQGTELAKAIKRKIIEERLNPYFKKNSSKDFKKELESLRSILTPAEKRAISHIYYSRAFSGSKVTNVTKQLEQERKNYIERKKQFEETKKQQERKHKEEVAITEKRRKQLQTKYEDALKEFRESNKSQLELLESLPEEIVKKLNTVSGTKQFKKDIASFAAREKGYYNLPNKNLKGEQLLQDVLDYKAADIITKGKVNASDETKSISELIKDKETLALLNEYKGAEWVNDFRNLVKILEKEEAAFRTFFEKEGAQFFKDKENIPVELFKLFKNPKLLTAKLVYKLLTRQDAAKLQLQKLKMFLAKHKKTLSESAKKSSYSVKNISKPIYEE